MKRRGAVSVRGEYDAQNVDFPGGTQYGRMRFGARAVTISEWLWGLLIALLAVGVLTASLLWAEYAGASARSSDAGAAPRPDAGMEFARELWAKYDTPPVPAPYVRPSHRALLRGAACIPISELLKNRERTREHSYSRSIAC